MIYLKFKKDIKHTSEYSVNTEGNKKVSNFKSRVPAILFSRPLKSIFHRDAVTK